MTKQKRFLKILTLTVSVVLVIFELIGLVLMEELYKSYGQPSFGWLKYYTQLSNIYSMVIAGFMVFFTSRDLINNKETTPKAMRILRFSVTCCLTETLLVTMFVLSPMGMMGGFIPLMFQGPNLFHHFLCPLISLLSFIFLEKGEKITFKHTLVAFIPTIVYGVVAVLLNVLKVWHGPYPFLYVYEQPLYMSLVWAVVVLGGAYAITLGVKLLADLPKKSNQKENKNG